jgi:hypothetical protein
MTIAVLVQKYKKCEKWIRTQLDAYVMPPYTPQARSMVAVMDATYVGDGWMLVVRDPNKKETVYYRKHDSETTFSYQEARRFLEQQGFVFSAIVGDGRVATPWLFSDIPVQMCHFHQEQIVIKYTTRNPRLTAGQELLDLVQTLPHTDEASFTDAFMYWCRTWDSFLKERTINPETKRMCYTHKKLRAARTSIAQHLPYLFTYQKYPKLCIPNTTNSLDGSFKKLKTAISVHTGMSKRRKNKLIETLLRGCV